MKKRAWRNLIVIQPDELMDNYPSSSGSGSSSTLLATVAPSTAPSEPVKPITFIDPVLNDTLNDTLARLGGTAVIDPNSYTVVIPETFIEPSPTTKPTDTTLTTVKETATNVVNDITSNIKDIFGGSDQASEDNTGLYLAGAVVVIGLLALLFKK